MKQTFPTRYIRVQKPSGNVSIHKLTASQNSIDTFVNNINARPAWDAFEMTQAEYLRYRDAEAAVTNSFSK
jgi:uncharacterized FlgJ-related protein